MSKHFWISLIKSGVRMVGFILLLTNFVWGITLLILAELIGIIEELYE